MIVVLSIASWLYCRSHVQNGKYPIKILQTVPRGFKHIGQPMIDVELVKALAPQLPVATIILFLEHIAIAKCRLRLPDLCMPMTNAALPPFQRSDV